MRRIYHSLSEQEKKPKCQRTGVIYRLCTRVIYVVCACVLFFLYSNLLSVIENWLLHVDMETEPSEV